MNMKKNILLVIKTVLLLMLFSNNAFSQGAPTTQGRDAIPYGVWEVSQIIIEKSTNGNIKKNTYNTAAEVKEYLPCPQTWEIKDSKTVVLHYSGGREETINYAFEDGQLVIGTMGAILKYRYSTSHDTLTLTITHKYGWNQPNGLVDEIEEIWIITLNLQN